MISDIAKSRLNRGQAADLFFYRDSHGNEVDLFLGEGRALIPIEVKSAATFSADFVRGMRGFQEAAGDRVRPGMVLYDGSITMMYRGNRVLNPLTTRLNV